MTDLSADETAVLTAIRDHPGSATRTLARTLKRRPAVIGPLVRSLSEKRRVERRPLVIQRSDGRPKTIEGLFAVVTTDPSLCPTCGARRRHLETGPECRATLELRQLGEALGWQRVPYGYGRAVQAGEFMWTQFLNSADYSSMVAATRHAKEWLALKPRITT